MNARLVLEHAQAGTPDLPVLQGKGRQVLRPEEVQ
jgi:hypothetical protein